ncbi:MTERFD1 [Cordylochernes scorpioides]|uniref:mTERFD1 n=1 Tax=Cordylochernes scorpioides TaxID=51811 RepID=A0ABY6KAS4_9ARAC|nr:MTERFD1 [Cordylochernes scorpioides]
MLSSLCGRYEGGHHHLWPTVRCCQTAATELVLECGQIVPSENSVELESLDSTEPHVDALSTDIDVDYLNTLCPQPSVSFNLASFINRSATLKRMVDLGIDLSFAEFKYPQLKYHLLRLNFEKDVVPLLKFFHGLQLDRSQIVSLLSRNPFLLVESVSNLETRVNYLRSKNFTKEDINRIITLAKNFLSFQTKDIDSRLGFLQNTFALTGNEVRKSTVMCPRVPLSDQRLINTNIHLMEDEFTLNFYQRKQLYLGMPKLYTLSKSNLLNRFELFTRDLKVPADLVVRQADVLLWRQRRISQRHQYLTQLGRAQYDPNEPCYVSLRALVTWRDPEFCQQVAKTSEEEFHKFLKTL